MATGLFGAPIGILAAGEEQDRDIKTTALAAKTLGDLAQVPAEIDLKNAQAGHFRALTGVQQQKYSDAALMTQLEAGARAQGRTADVNDLAKARTSVADPIQKFYDYAVGQGAPLRITAPLAKQIAEIKEKEGMAAYREGQAAASDLDQQAKVAARVGAIAKTAMDSPQGYDQMRLLLSQAKNLPPQTKSFIDSLPADWESGKARLAPLVQSSMTAKDQIAAQQKERELKEKEKLTASTIARNTATAASAGAHVENLRERTTQLRKAGGEGTPAQVAAQEQLAEARARKMEADQLKTSPYVPLDKSAVTAGKTYTLRDGRVARAIAGADGGVAFDVISPAWKKREQPRTAADIRKARVTEPDDEDD